MEKQRVRKRLDRTAFAIPDVASHAECSMRRTHDGGKRRAQPIRVGDVLSRSRAGCKVYKHAGVSCVPEEVLGLRRPLR